MSVIAIVHCQVDPADADEFRARHTALVAATRAAVPGLIEARLGRTDERGWAAIWRWESAEHLAAARASVGGGPVAGAAFALATEITGTEVEVLDEL